MYFSGSGKSIIFIAAVLALKKKYGPGNFVTVVVTPLVSLNENHSQNLIKVISEIPQFSTAMSILTTIFCNIDFVIISPPYFYH